MEHHNLYILPLKKNSLDIDNYSDLKMKKKFIYQAHHF